MTGLLRGLLALVVTVIITVFAALNRFDVSIAWNPLDVEQTHDVPLYLVALGATLFGFIAGALMVWLNMSPLRKQKRQQKKEIKTLEKEMTKLKNDKFQAGVSSPSAETLPALTAQ